MTGTILERILATKHEEIDALLSRISLAELKAQCGDLPATRGFKDALGTSPPNPLPYKGRGNQINEDILPPPPARRGRGEGGERVSLIAEVKKASPSKGVIRPDFDPVTIAQAYHAGGASCLSVLTDTHYFQGSLNYLHAIREVVSLPLLRKDFLIDPAQVYEARIAGADAILLIVAAIPEASRLRELRELAESLGMDVLVEIHDEVELVIAVESGATLIGVNNRDLHTFAVRLEIAETLIPQFPTETVAVAESGIFTPDDVRRMADAGANAILVGESLMRSENITEAVQNLMVS
jgi:indole-3-glycerol phosphate synthase